MEESQRDTISIVRRRAWIVVVGTLAGVVLALILTRLTPRTYEARGEIAIKTPTAEAQANSLLTSLQISPDTFKRTQLTLITNPWMLSRIEHNLAQRDGIFGVKDLSRNLIAEDIPDTELIDIYARDHNPRTAQVIANETVTTFREYLSQVDADAARGALSTMQNRVEQARAAMEQSSEKLAAFETKFGILDLDKQTDANVTAIANSEQAAAQAQQDLDAAQASITAVQRQLNQQNRLLKTNGVRSNSLIDAIRAQLADQQNQLRLAQETYVDNPDAIAPIQARVSDLRKQLQAEIAKVAAGSGSVEMQEQLLIALSDAQRQALALQSRYNTVRDQLAQQIQNRGKLPYLQQQISQLTQNAAVDRDLYQKTLGSFEQIDMDRLSQPSVVQVTGLATLPTAPVLPKPMANILLGAALGFILALSLVVLMERMDQSVHSEAELRKLAPDVPILGVIPQLQPGDLTLTDNASGPGSGAYRMLWSNLGFVTIDEPIHSVVVTSALQGEGKSQTSAHLARTAAEDGKKVILVDCDLRRPSQHKLFGAGDRPGITDVASGRASLDDALFPTTQPGLTLLPAGQALPLNPATLLRSARIAQIRQELLERADLVIFDTPPGLMLPDALVLGAQSQGLIQVIESGRTRRDCILHALESIQRARVTHLGIVFNRVRRADRHGYYYYEYNQRPQSSNGNGKTGASSTNGKTLSGSHHH